MSLWKQQGYNASKRNNVPYNNYKGSPQKKRILKAVQVYVLHYFIKKKSGRKSVNLLALKCLHIESKSTHIREPSLSPHSFRSPGIKRSQDAGPCDWWALAHSTCLCKLARDLLLGAVQATSCFRFCSLSSTRRKHLQMQVQVEVNFKVKQNQNKEKKIIANSNPAIHSHLETIPRSVKDYRILLYFPSSIHCYFHGLVFIFLCS